ncbi:hypothetical protein THAOC_10817, partial [Thalassiosira oceanica]
TCDETDWTNQVDHARRKGRKTISVDLRGHGKSTSFKSDFTVEEMGKDVSFLPSRIDVKCAILVGHSMGARVAMEAAVRSRDIVRGIILVDGSRGRSGSATAKDAKAAFEAYGYGNVIRSTFGPMFLQTTLNSVKIMDRAINFPPKVGIESMLSVMKWDGTQFESKCGELSGLPMQLIQSSHTDDQGRRIPVRKGTEIEWHGELKQRATCSDVEVVMVENCGHFAHLDEPGIVNECMERFVEKFKTRAIGEFTKGLNMIKNEEEN